MEIIPAILFIWIMYRICKYIFMDSYNQVKRAHKAIELWEDDDDWAEEEEESKEVSKRNG